VTIGSSVPRWLHRDALSDHRGTELPTVERANTFREALALNRFAGVPRCDCAELETLLRIETVKRRTNALQFQRAKVQRPTQYGATEPFT
jgi:hypothetical protein